LGAGGFERAGRPPSLMAAARTPTAGPRPPPLVAAARPLLAGLVLVPTGCEAARRLSSSFCLSSGGKDASSWLQKMKSNLVKF